MNLDELRSVQSKERQKDSLQNLRPSFYQEVGEYIADLEDERDHVADQSDDPFSSPEVGRLTDEIETAKDVVEAVYERRMGKLVKQASLAAAGMPADDEGLTAEEADLFDDLVERISSNKSRVLDVLEGVEAPTDSATTDTGPAEGEPGTPTDGAEPGHPDSSPPAPDTDHSGTDPIDSPGAADASASPSDHAADDGPPVPPQDPPADSDAESTTILGDEASTSSDERSDPDGSSGVTPADVMGGDGPEIDDTDTASETPPPPSDESNPDATATDSDSGSSFDSDSDTGDDSDDVDRMTVRITRDIGSILGVDDREYSLSTDDIVTLPEQNATPLLEQEAAESLE